MAVRTPQEKTSVTLHKGAIAVCMAGFVLDIMSAVSKISFLPSYSIGIFIVSFLVLIIWAKIREKNGEEGFVGFIKPAREKSSLEQQHETWNELSTNPMYSNLPSNIHHRS